MASYLTPDVSSSVNMYNKETRITNTCVGANANGAEVALDGTDLSNFIAVEPNTQYTVTSGFPAGIGGAQYASDGTFVAIITRSTDAPYTFTTIASARFVRMNIRRSSTDPETYMMTKASEWPNEYVPFVAAPSYNITYVINGHGIQPSATTGARLPNPLPILTAEGYEFGGWYTDSELTTPAVAGTTLNANITLYAKWNENQSTGMTTIRASYNGTPLSEFKVLNLKVDDENIITDFKGKKVVFFGDSITYWTDCYPKTSGWGSFPLGNDYYLKNYLTLAREKLGLITVNKGVSGAKSSAICSSMRSYNLSDVYAVVLTCGTNDYNNNVDPNTYKSNITSALSAVMTNYPKVKIYCMTMPYNTITGKTYNIRDYGDKFEEACLEYNLPLLRIDKTLPINSINASTFLVDGIHPNNDGHKLLADQFIPFLLNHSIIL